MSCVLPKINRTITDYCLNVRDKSDGSVDPELLRSRVRDTLLCIGEDHQNVTINVYADRELFVPVHRVMIDLNGDKYTFAARDFKSIILSPACSICVCFLSRVNTLPLNKDNIIYVYMSLSDIIEFKQIRKLRTLRLLLPVYAIDAPQHNNKSFTEFIVYRQNMKKNAARSYSVLNSYEFIEIVSGEKNYSDKPIVNMLEKNRYSEIVGWNRDCDVSLNSPVVGPYRTGHSVWDVLNDVHDSLIVSHRGYMTNLNVSNMSITQKPDDYLIYLLSGPVQQPSTNQSPVS